MPDAIPLNFLSAPGHAGSDHEQLAYKYVEGKGPTVIWCGGLKSDMEGGKAVHLHEWAHRTHQSYVRFDYFGHGASSGRFRDGTLTRWSDDVVQIIDELADADVILIGSSMGGWASMLAAKKRSERVKALCLIAPAPDFTEKLMWDNWDDEAKRAVMEDGIHYEPSDYDEPYEYSRELIEDGRENLLLDSPYVFKGPVRILQGVQDPVVPWTYAQQLLDVMTSEDMTLTLVKSGDHSLSQSDDLDRLVVTVEDLLTILAS